MFIITILKDALAFNWIFQNVKEKTLPKEKKSIFTSYIFLNVRDFKKKQAGGTELILKNVISKIEYLKIN